MRTVLARLVVGLMALEIVVAQAPPPAATGLVVGSGNFFSPMVADLDKAIAFYRDGLGFAVTGAPSDAASNAPLRNMFGLPEAQLRWNIARLEGMRGGVEIVEVKRVESRTVTRNVQDPGAMTLVLAVRDIDVLLSRLLPLGATMVTTGGKPVDVTLAGAPARAALVKSSDGHFLQLVERPAPAAGATAPAANSAALVTEIRVRLTVDSVDRALRLYRDDLGLQEQSPGSFTGNRAVLQMLGLRGGTYRQAITQVPGSGLFLQFIEFKDAERRNVGGGIQDPGSTRVQLQVKDLDAAIRAVVRAGGRVVSSGEMPVQLPAGRGGTIRAAVVRDPDNLFLVLIEQAAPAAPPTR
jgi:catechol 2,3-dioxygenase-like lactoylglutathione lyase family enzyme